MSHRVARPVGRGAFSSCDAEAQALVVAQQAGGQAEGVGVGRGGAGLHGEGHAAAAPLPREVVVLGPQRRGGDGVLRFHHPLPQNRHGDRGARAPQGLHRRVMLGPLQTDVVHLRMGGDEKAESEGGISFKHQNSTL